VVPKAIEQTTGYSLAQTCKLMRARVHGLLDEIGLHRGQQFVLGALWRGEGITHSELARKLHVRPATVTNALKRMERAGLVERRPDQEDQRVSRVYLTDAGRSIRAGVETVWSDLEKLAFAGFTPQECTQFVGLLHRIQENLMQETTDVGSQE
jgi:DNA-binding MarR family transcriptional regulator